MKIADKIKEIRLQKYLSMREFGNALGVSKATISRWEKGSHRPSVGAIKAIADFANVPVDEFYDEQKHGRSASRIKRKNRAFVKLYGKYGK